RLTQAAGVLDAQARDGAGRQDGGRDENRVDREDLPGELHDKWGADPISAFQAQTDTPGAARRWTPPREALNAGDALIADVGPIPTSLEAPGSGAPRGR